MNTGPPSLAGTGKGMLREYHLIRISGWVLFSLVFVILWRDWSMSAAGQWLLQTLLLWWLVSFQVYRRLHLNRPQAGAEPYKSFGWGNRLTILRGGLVAAVGGFLFLEPPDIYIAWMPAVLYTLAGIIDRIDGYVARKTRHTSELGSEMDTNIDALGLAAAPLLAYWYGQIHWSYLLVSLAYYLFRGGIVLRRKTGREVIELRPNPARRMMAGFQMGFVAVILYPVLRPPVTILAGFAFMVPLLFGFIIDWLIVTGRINPLSQRYARYCRVMQTACNDYLQPLLRILVVILLFQFAMRSDYSLAITGVPWDVTFYSCVLLLSAGLILLGIGGRIATLAVLALLGRHTLYHPLIPLDIVLLFAVIWLLLYGTGRFSIWRREDDWLNRYDGA